MRAMLMRFSPRKIDRVFAPVATNYHHHPGRQANDYDGFGSWNPHIPPGADDESSFNILELFAQLHRSGSVPGPCLLNKVIAASAKMNLLSIGEQAHSVTIKLDFNANVFVGTSLIQLYFMCDRIASARQVFDMMPDRNPVTWTSLISGYLKTQFPNLALEVFLDMLWEGIEPTPSTVSAVLVACSQIEAGDLGIQVHGLSLKAGFSSSIVVGTNLIGMYSKCSSIENSKRVFDHMVDKNIVTWTSMVNAYAQSEQPKEAMILIREMQILGLTMNCITYNCLLSSFLSPDDLNHCKQVHCQVIREGIDSNAYLLVSLMSVYSRCGSLGDFCNMCSTILIWDQISWNAAIAGFSHLGVSEEALKYFIMMSREGITMNFFTFTSILKAVGFASALEEGKQIHALAFKIGCLQSLSVQNGLVCMYARSGAIDDSKRAFLSMEEHDLISWNSLISGCAGHGYGSEVVELFEQMRRNGIKPDHTTFLSVLSACSHVGLVDKGTEYFDLMRNDNTLEPPRVEHYACMVDLFSRAGYLDQAEAFLNCMSIKPTPSVFKALLSACQVHGNMDIAMRSARKLLDLYPNDPAIYVMLSNVLAGQGNWADAAGVRKLMCDRGVRKKPGYSWIGVSEKDIGSTVKERTDV